MSKLVTEISEAAIVDNDLVTKNVSVLIFQKLYIVDHYCEVNEFSDLIIKVMSKPKYFAPGFPKGWHKFW